MDVVYQRVWCVLVVALSRLYFVFFFFNDTATTEIYTLSLHDALPISVPRCWGFQCGTGRHPESAWWTREKDRKSTRLNSSHGYISYAVFCLKKKKSRSLITPPCILSSAHSIDPQLSSAHRAEHLLLRS